MAKEDTNLMKGKTTLSLPIIKAQRTTNWKHIYCIKEYITTFPQTSSVKNKTHFIQRNKEQLNLLIMNNESQKILVTIFQ